MSQDMLSNVTLRTITVHIGLLGNESTTIRALKSAGFWINDWAREMLPAVSFANESQTLELVIATVAELGFPQGATTKEIYAAAHDSGYRLCPAEVGPALRQQYTDQIEDEYLLIGMEPIITHFDGDLHVFNVGHFHGARWLYSAGGLSVGRWGSGWRWVFVRSKQ
jgi:hypothetical protein